MRVHDRRRPGLGWSGYVTSLVTLAAAACSFTGPIATPVFPSLVVSNATTIPVTLVVNGGWLRPVAAGTLKEVPVAELPPMPWSVEVRSPGGRVLVTMSVMPGQARRTTFPDGSTEQAGAAARVDLSCGRLDVYYGPPLMGPPPLPDAGHPGDCS